MVYDTIIHSRGVSLGVFLCEMVYWSQHIDTCFNIDTNIYILNSVQYSKLNINSYALLFYMFEYTVCVFPFTHYYVLYDLYLIVLKYISLLWSLFTLPVLELTAWLTLIKRMATLFTESHQCDQMAYYLKGLENYIHYFQMLLSIKMLQSGPSHVFLYNRLLKYTWQ